MVKLELLLNMLKIRKTTNKTVLYFENECLYSGAQKSGR